MKTPFAYGLPKIYQYTYPTFVDTPQSICVHSLTPDGQQAFVSYPHHSNRRAAQLIPLSWFDSVVLVELEGQPCLMHFLEVVLTGWFVDPCVRHSSVKRRLTKRTTYAYSGPGAVFSQ